MEHVADVDFGGFDVRPLSWPVSPERLSFQAGEHDSSTRDDTAPEQSTDTGSLTEATPAHAGTTNTTIANASAFDVNHHGTNTPPAPTTIPNEQPGAHLTQAESEDEELQQAIALSQQSAQEDEERRERQRQRVLEIFEKGRARSIEVPVEEFVKNKPSLKGIPLPAYDGTGYPSYM
ncbi:hypothetical protein CLAFUW4_08596 [Fulvia fulva]|uniref:Uncharacterized protein n=1 Tax=Passalora fulva TaxID=5499 RepID=A0A9Q8P708_PASFU|nr:uncharacterized protein CLAFUR5_08698 [Fulvia fulva]KAK4629262.1 hypothetical protein CLAFUR4_08599 [Fulvia fulva]KAK4630688.1 hypothetical protein CLAFUR0_08594 [Fulvia fulva]UJO15675.1 hypothetical protein CLAFUR5_08698 [Fulvia fulva]WPV12992.1 hypothetical protein CLAFUW4_08596 [Fulvia fulva]WPV27709.1 hypothetical protein CLAFUW7_08594 [Fulvia fulva]